jgi:aminoglycoside 2'-N-acetyltransferase I
MIESLHIERIDTPARASILAGRVLALCDAAYGENTAAYLEALGAGTHLLGWQDGILVSHLMWVTRWLQPGDSPPLRTAYVELVATAPALQGRGFATALLERFRGEVLDFDLAALSPATESLYARLGWKIWRGPLAVRTGSGTEPTPGEQVMVLPLPRTPPLNLHSPLSVEWRSGEVW